jgi:hypothetical protein
MDDAQNPSLVNRGSEDGLLGRGATPATTAVADGAGSRSKPGPAAGFLVQLALAMHAVAERQRGRIDDVIAERAAAQRDRTRARARLEAGELRRLADDDLKGIEEWSEAEVARIRDEARRRAEERRAALEEYLRRHEAIIEAEIGSVDRAIADYRGTLDQFFARLGASMDPSEIARHAESVPAMPDLEEIRSSARAEAVAATTSEAGTRYQATPAEYVDRTGDTPLVGVMGEGLRGEERDPSLSVADF